ncbi:lipid-A-disaccharide synthase [Gimesia panareensis]|uniref:Lipid-A-disaccharide synthase n=1 Tax=Gimesia panareensis TaxID=2527978 RepID=A0A517Q0W1_9PLAN|nr:lipid-A-disaccharide synthase [Gimesia panareensis]QDT25232.1 Glycosyl transferase [Gimesia panareensis]QDU48190.1 Glycosyl transferase [Gimesia panareensis]
MHLFFSVGEPSGDQHTAHLIEEIRARHPDTRFSAFGGPEMQAAGCHLEVRLTDYAVMGILNVLPLIFKFIQLIRQVGAYLEQERPDAVVLVDFPGFNWWVAKKAKALGIPVFYYLPPQLWAWAPWRIRRVRKNVDYILSGLQFEKQWYESRGVNVDYIGHPFFDEVASRKLEQATLTELKQSAPQIVGVLPGSRTNEVTRNFPVMLQTIRRLSQQFPEAIFPVACYREKHLELCRNFIREQQAEDLPLKLYLKLTPEIIEAADCCLMVSGSVSLEMLARKTPAVVLYRSHWGMYFLGQVLITCKFMSLPNLIAGREIMPEFPSVGNSDKVVSQMTTILADWLGNPLALERARGELTSLYNETVIPGASAQAAEAILNHTGAQTASRAAA